MIISFNESYLFEYTSLWLKYTFLACWILINLNFSISKSWEGGIFHYLPELINVITILWKLPLTVDMYQNWSTDKCSWWTIAVSELLLHSRPLFQAAYQIPCARFCLGDERSESSNKILHLIQYFLTWQLLKAEKYISNTISFKSNVRCYIETSLKRTKKKRSNSICAK